MLSLPHAYTVTAEATGIGPIKIATRDQPDLELGDSLQLGGVGEKWSPELLLLASASSCYIVALRSLSQASKLPWRHVECAVTGYIDRTDGVVRFTRIATDVTLSVANAVSEDLCERVLRKTERICLIANSLRATRDLTMHITRGPVR